MANTFARAGQFLTITLDGSTDWNSLTETDEDGYFPVGCRIQYLQFKGATAGNGIIIREGAPDAATKILDAEDITGSGIAMGLQVIGVCRPCVAAADVASGDVLILHFA